MKPNLLTKNSVEKFSRRIKSLDQVKKNYNHIIRRWQHATPLPSSTPETLTSIQDDSPKYNERPRWSYTPVALKMPVRIRPLDPNKIWECNSDPKKLDCFYKNFLGPGGDKLLSDEVKWLAITHKSFEQGARGFNDRLAFLGRRILNLQTNLMLFSTPVVNQSESLAGIESEGRVPFEHPALGGLKNLFDPPLTIVLSKDRLASFATSVGMRSIIRWYPRMINDLDASGIETVLVTSLYAIVGAVALEKGGEVSSDIAKNNILKPMGIL
ncbi:hypothetical protein EPUL_003260 [Erysiphe pulchra]|uniref:RNase III domain-containing protein n=1 Tax=Erysiphe pulchra TaxID=225359 RepID=A0A2S4PNE9_9PEZI|nr:hypothetical protein EPUL_003260 [Erysiphe pulchra]